MVFGCVRAGVGLRGGVWVWVPHARVALGMP